MPEETPEKPFNPEEILKQQVSDRFRKRIEELRSKIAALDRDLKDRLDAEATVRVVFDGEGGGTWYLNVGGGEAAIGIAPVQPPILSIHQSLADFRATTALGGGFGFGPGGGQGELTKSRIARLRAIKGTILFKVTDLPDGRELPVTIHFGEGEPAPQPQTVVSIKADDARKLRSGELNPQMAFMQGQIKIQGDAALAMAVGMATM